MIYQLLLRSYFLTQQRKIRLTIEIYTNKVGIGNKQKREIKNPAKRGLDTTCKGCPNQAPVALKKNSVLTTWY